MNDLLDALAGFARDHGVAVGDPVVLSVSSNIVVHLAPAPVVARVAHVTAAGRDRPDVALAREIVLARHLHGAGVPTIPPSGELPPGPHLIAGRHVSFLEYVPLEPLAPDDAPLVGNALVELLVAARTLDDAGGLFDRSQAEETAVVLASLADVLADDDHRVLVEWVRETSVEVDGVLQPLHGDPHRNNVGRRTDGEIVWFDFDDAVYDSPMVDLTTLLRSWPAAGEAACVRMGVDPRSPTMRRLRARRESWGALWDQHFARALGGDAVDRSAAALARRRR